MIEIGQVFWFSFLSGRRYGVGIVTHFSRNEQIMLARYYNLCPESPATPSELENVLLKGVVTYSALDSTYGFVKGLLNPFAKISLSKELKQWPLHYSPPLFPSGSGHLIRTDQETLERLQVIPVSHEPTDPLIPLSGIGSLDFPRELAEIMWSKGRLKPYEDDEE